MDDDKRRRRYWDPFWGLMRVDDKRRGWYWDPFWGLSRDGVPVGFITGMAALAFVFFYFYVIVE